MVFFLDGSQQGICAQSLSIYYLRVCVQTGKLKFILLLNGEKSSSEFSVFLDVDLLKTFQEYRLFSFSLDSDEMFIFPSACSFSHSIIRHKFEYRQ